MLRVIEEIRPAWVIGENVAGIVSMAEPIGDIKVESRTISRFADEDFYEAVLSQQERMLLGRILQELEDIGYEVQPFVIPACATDAAHRRDRVAIVGCAVENANSVGREQQGVLQEQPWRTESERTGQSSADRPSSKMSADVADAQGIECKESISTDKTGTTRLANGGVVADAEHGSGSVRRDRELSAAEKNGGGRNNNGRRAPEHVAGERRPAKPRMGGVADGIPSWLDGYWVNEPDIPRVAAGVPNRVERLKGLGNAVYWRQFYPIFKYIAEIIAELQ